MQTALLIFLQLVQVGMVFVAKYLGEKIGYLKAQQEMYKALGYQLSLYDDRLEQARENAQNKNVSQQDMELPAEMLKSLLQLFGNEEKIKEYAGHYKPLSERKEVKPNDPGRSFNQT